MKINSKIKNLRKKTGLSQDNLYPKNPSQISLIESGKIKNPSEPTLRTIAKALEISFDELIEGTDWNPNQGTSKSSGKYAFSANKFSIQLDDNDIKIIPKSYLSINENGEENRFCEDFGTPLVSDCSSCKRTISCSKPRPIMLQRYLT